MKQAGVEISTENPGRYERKFEDRKRLNESIPNSNKEWTAKLFSELEFANKERLRTIYKIDFEMFSYDAYLYG